MKRIITATMVITTLITASGQSQSPAAIARKWDAIRQLCEKYDDGADSVYRILNEQITATEKAPVANAIWHSCLAQFLEKYYKPNQYKISQRTTLADQVPEDFKEWDNVTFQRVIREEYLRSITVTSTTWQLLTGKPTFEYYSLLKNASIVRPELTLYDILAYRYLDYVCPQLPRIPESEPDLRGNEDLWNEEQFLNMPLSVAESNSDVRNVLAVYQSLTKLHKSREHHSETVRLNIVRADFLREHGLAPDNSETWYINWLTDYGKAYEGTDTYGFVAYRLAQLYMERGNLYNETEHPEYRNDLATAIALFKQSLKTPSANVLNQNADYIQEAKECIKALEIKYVGINLDEEPVAVGAPHLCRIHYKNLKRAYIRLVPVSYAQSKLTMRDLNEQQFSTLLAIKPAYQQSIDLPDMQDYRKHEGYYGIPGQPAGDYMLMISDKPFPCSVKECCEIITYQVTDIALYQRQTITGWEFLVVDRTTGEPLKGAKISSKNEKGSTPLCTTDENGWAQIRLGRNNNTHSFFVEYHNQRLHNTRMSWWWSNDTVRKVTKKCQLLTDRMLYRPGQTLFFKGICSEEISKNDHTQNIKLLKELTVKVVLEDANWQKVGEIVLTTNEFGSIDSSFVLPETGLTGRYHLHVVYDKMVLGIKEVSVEEYKRPTFEVTLNNPTETVKLGQTVEVEGVAEALAGYPIADAEVKYKVQRQISYWGIRWKWWNQSPAYDVVAGTATTDADGRFRITFPTEKSLDSPESSSIYRYLITATVTDITGETHTSTTQIFVSRRSLVLSVDIPEEVAVNQSDNQFPISLTNISDVPQEGLVEYEILKLTPPDRILYPKKELDVVITDEAELQKMFPTRAFHGENASKNWPSTMIAKGNVNVSKSGTQFAIPQMATLPSGYYRICFKVQDPDGEWVEEIKTVHLYRLEEEKCTAYNVLWCDCPDTVTAGGELCIRFGSRLDNAHVFCEIWHNDNLITRQWVDLQRDMNTLQVPVREGMEGSVKVRMFLMADNQQTEFRKSVRILNLRKDIRFEFLRFRDKTLPGSPEEYQIRLKDMDGKPISAEMLCTMYDFSLDVLGGSNPLNIGFPFAYNNYPRLFNRETTYEHYLFHDYNDYIDDYRSRVSLPFNDFKYNFSCYPMPRMKYGAKYNQEVVLNVVEDNFVARGDIDLETGEAAEEIPACAFIDEAAAGMSKAPAVTDNSKEQLRTNFNETAFFLPQLRTDEHGDVFISFTMPDALTKWKMQGVAHNSDLQCGRFEKFVQTAKDVMIVPNAPRFLREGDTMDFSAKIVNTSGRNICGYVTLQMFNAVNNQPIVMICDEGTNDGGGRDAKFCVSTTTGTQQYEISANTSSEIHFRIVIPADVPAITYRIIAHNTDPQDIAGDGEEKTLPVLTNRMMVTETMPFYISGKGTKTFTFNKLRESFGISDARDAVHHVSTTLKHYRLTVECTPNPVWYAIQAMPYMMEYPHECNEQRFSRYYANALATHILKANPVVEEVFNRWQVESPDAFCSALEKNQELKSVVLEETPWVLDAQREGGNKQALAAMFDFKRMAKEEDATLKKLQQAQNGDGGWPWFSGGKSSDFITRHIVAGFGHLKALGVSTDVANSTLRNAVSYMDAQMYQRYLDRKKYHYTYVDETHYLYARSFYKDKISAKHKVAYDTCYKALLKGWKDETFYTQAMIALTAWRNGDQQVAKKIVAYLKSMAQHDEEMGMFWKKQGGGWFWYEQPVERQAMLIEAFHTITPEDKESLAQMQLWLLKQKQTQHWGTTKSTTEAVYSLLLNQTLVAEDKTFSLTIGDVRLPDESTQAEAGTDYFKKAWTGEEITADKANVRLEKGTDGPAWGGLYWQYFENLDKITRSDDKNLVIEKQLYKVENTDKGEVLKAITEGQPLQKGDKVRVRVVITADRDMEFVHLKDMRAATFEPVNVFSQYKYQDGLWYYEATKDAATHFFIDWMPKGKYVFEYTLFATQSGDFSNGITHIECMYAPEFQSHSAGIRVKVR